MDGERDTLSLSLLEIAFGPDHHSLRQESGQKIEKKQSLNFLLLGEPGGGRIETKMLVLEYSGADKVEGTYEQHTIKARLQKVTSATYSPEELEAMGLVPESEWELRYTTNNNQGTAKWVS